ncbi:MAG: DUF3267 domain-containing protein [Chloroflexota bacterium]
MARNFIADNATAIDSPHDYGRLSPTNILPENATYYHRFIMANWKFNLVVNVGSIFLLIIAGWVFLGLAIATKPQYAIQVFVYLIDLPLFLMTLVGVMFVHELCHFLGYWAFSKKLPKIGYKLMYAHADGGALYFPKNQFVMISLAPFVIITTVGLIWLTQAHILTIPILILGLAINTAGSLGDLILSMWLLSHPVPSYVFDEGGSIAIYKMHPIAQVSLSQHEAVLS